MTSVKNIQKCTETKLLWDWSVQSYYNKSLLAKTCRWEEIVYFVSSMQLNFTNSFASWRWPCDVHCSGDSTDEQVRDVFSDISDDQWCWWNWRWLRTWPAESPWRNSSLQVRLGARATSEDHRRVCVRFLFCSFLFFFLSRAYMYAGAAGVVFFIAVCLRVCVKKLKNYLS